ncbi:MAG TPA: succinate dehydrogenase assembly factor 4 [Alphaproteobacteria bacterium]
MSKSGENPAADDTAALSAPPDAAVETDAPALAKQPAPANKKKAVPEIGGPSGLEPTRYGDWERKGRCIDF